MALNPLRTALGRLGLTAFASEAPFQAEAEAALARFRTVRSELERQVFRGDLTVKTARARAAAAAASLRQTLKTKADGYSPAPRAFLDRLVQAAEARTAARAAAPLEALQRESNRLLRQLLIEQQLVHRTTEFEGRAFVRPLPGGSPAPTLESLLAFHEQAVQAGDEAAQEWVRRQLEGIRNRVPSPEDQRRIDAACERPDQVNPAIVARYVEALQTREDGERETFVRHAIEDQDANACCAAFVLARQTSEAVHARWVRLLLDGVKEFPDAALTTLRAWESEARRQESEAARARAEYAIAVAEAEAELPDLEAPTDADLKRQARVLSRPVAVDQPIGLNLTRRGLTPEEFAALQAQAASPPAAPEPTA
jgi:hypothetical protein